jgi:hypothetical protein
MKNIFRDLKFSEIDEDDKQVEEEKPSKKVLDYLFAPDKFNGA